MDATHSQAFRAHGTSKIISIPALRDAKSGQDIVRWQDILRYFENAKSLANGSDTVLFLTDEALEDLIPLRIAHHPGVVLEVVTQDASQDDSNGDGRTDDGRPPSMSMPRNTGELYTDMDRNQTLARRSRGLTSGAPVQRASSMNIDQSSGRFDQPLQEMDLATNLQEELWQLRRQTEETRQKMKDVQQKMQQVDKVANGTCNIGTGVFVLLIALGFLYYLLGQQGQQNGVARTTAQQSDQQAHDSQQLFQQHIDETTQKLQVFDGVPQEVQETDQRSQEVSQQQLEEQMDKVFQLLGRSDQRAEHSLQQKRILHQQVQEKIEEFQQTLQMSGQREQHRRQGLQDEMKDVLQKVQQMEQQVQQTSQRKQLAHEKLQETREGQQRLQQDISDADRKMKELGQQIHLFIELVRELDKPSALVPVFQAITWGFWCITLVTCMCR
ncbi:hypothetical protein B0O80DRAFT_127238 [Mortierella sp. GBAus27b]|nr:hypothetical protein B0O80DRAFT_127238 [Mortierella sp. GBAus27b]